MLAETPKGCTLSTALPCPNLTLTGCFAHPHPSLAPLGAGDMLTGVCPPWCSLPPPVGARHRHGSCLAPAQVPAGRGCWQGAQHHGAAPAQLSLSVTVLGPHDSPAPLGLAAGTQGLQDCVADLLQPFQGDPIDLVAGIDAMGFILGAAVATALRKGFLAIRKAGHLCVETLSEPYTDYSGREKVMEVCASSSWTSGWKPGAPCERPSGWWSGWGGSWQASRPSASRTARARGGSGSATSAPTACPPACSHASTATRRAGNDAGSGTVHPRFGAFSARFGFWRKNSSSTVPLALPPARQPDAFFKKHKKTFY
ncbi:uncharacterized protein [Anser cygnoides]|uniref:uncharacterized protein isoform X3 n=1 Tax=Anser cygnoides TaxID=8845 RepID=UPI0034D19B0D